MSCVTWCDYDGTIPDKQDPDSQLAEWEIDLATFSNWLNNQMLGIFEKKVPVIPSQLYVAVHSTLCSAASPGTELSGDGYARVPVYFERVSDIQRWSLSTATTPAASADWSVLSFSLWDDANPGGGNYYAFGNLTEEYTVLATKAIQWQANKIIIGMGSAA